AAAPRPSLWRRLANWREDQVARRALRLAGEPCLVLDPTRLDFAIANAFYDPATGFVGGHSYFLETILHD
ncbi:hypothetical protein R0G64_32760, partial [Pseudomonas otitidis]|nr:hypothetical protein [Pseudomonas otitidis]